MNEKIPCRLCKSEDTESLSLKGIWLDEFYVTCRNCGHQFQTHDEELEKDVDIKD